MFYMNTAQIMTPCPWYLSTSHHRALPSPVWVNPPCAYFLPDFLMPCEPVLRGPLPLPTVLARSSRAFLSILRGQLGSLLCCRAKRGIVGYEVGIGRHKHTSCELGLVRDVILVEILSLLLGLLIVDRVCTSCDYRVSLIVRRCLSYDAKEVENNQSGAYLLVLKAS